MRHVVLTLLILTFYIPSPRIAYSQEPIQRSEETPLTREVQEKRAAIRMHFTAARGFFVEKRYEEALKELQELLTLDPGDHVAHFAMGMALKELERFKEAVEAFKKATGLRPGDANPYAQMGFIMVRVGDYEEGVKSLEKFLSLAPDSPLANEAGKALEFGKKGMEAQVRFETVARLIREEKWDDALKENEILHGLEPDSHRVFYNSGLIYSKLKRNDEAINELKKAIEREPKYFLAHYQLALVYEEMGRLEETITAYEAALANTTDENEKEKLQGRLDTLRGIKEAPLKAEETKMLLEKGDIPGAVREAERLVAGKKMDPKAYLILGGIYMQAERSEEAAATLEKGAGLAPRNMEIRILLARAYEKLGRLSQAVTHYRAAAALGKETAEGKGAMDKAQEIEMRLHFDKGKGLKESGDIEGALREIEAILTISPENPVALFNAGVLHDLLERSGQAETLFKKAIKVAPDYVQARLQLALLLERQRRFVEAMDAYNSVLSLQKEGDEADIVMGRLAGIKDAAEVTERLQKTISLLEKHDLDGALKEVEATLAIYPGNYVAYFYLGLIYTQSEKPDDAITALQKTVEIKPSFLQAYMALGGLLIQQEKTGDAREIFEKVADIGKGTKEGERAAIFLKRLRPWRGSFSLNHNFNTNITYGVKPDPSLSSNYGLNWTYQIWRIKKAGINTGVSGSESVYYNSQITPYGYTFYIRGDYKYGAENILAIDLSQRRNYVARRPSQMGYTLRINGNYKYSEDKILSLDLSQKWDYLDERPSSRGFSLSWNLAITPQTIPTSISLGYQFSTSRYPVSKANDMDNHSLSINLGQSFGLKDSVSGGYSFSTARNMDPLGNNYGNRAHTISLGYSRILLPQVSGNLSYSIGLVQFMNPDSMTLFRNFRRNVNHNIGGGLSFPLSENVSFYTRYNYTNSKTNIPRPTAELLQTLEDILALPIPTVGGGYESHTASISLGIRF